MGKCRVDPRVAQSLIAELAADVGGTLCASLKHLLIAEDGSTDCFSQVSGASSDAAAQSALWVRMRKLPSLWCWGGQGVHAIAPCAVEKSS